MRRSSALWFVFLLSSACDASSTDTDAGRGGRDAGRRVDATTPTGDAGPVTGSDGGPRTDSGGPGGPGCDGHDYLFCEDFESATVGALPAGWTVGGGWSAAGMDGSVVISESPFVTDTQAHSGRRALYSAVASQGQHRAEHALDALGAARGTHWGRVYYRVGTPIFTGGGYVHSTMVALLRSDGNECRVVDTVMAPNLTHQFLFNIPDDSCCTGSSYDWQYDEAWHCAEWRIDAGEESFQFFIDGAEVDDIAFDYSDGRSRIEPFAGIALGWRNYQNTRDMPFTSWLDDLVIDDERVGCD